MKSFFSRLVKHLRTAYKDGAIFRTRVFPKADIVFECHDNHRAIKINGLAYAQILDGFQDELKAAGYECITFAQQGSKVINDAYGQVFSPTTVVEEGVGLLSKIALGKDFYDSKYKCWLFNRVLSRVGCRLVVGIQPTRGLVKACNLLRIPVVDLLHGYCITSKHHVYGNNNINRLKEEFLCSDYVALDHHSKKVIENSLARAGKRARCWSYLSPVFKKPESTEPTEVERFIGSNRKTFLVTLQWGIERFEGSFPHVDGELHPRLVEVIRLGIGKGLGFIIKPHPVLLRNEKALARLREYCDTQGGLWLEKTMDLQNLLRLVDAHITIFSSSTREASLLGRKTLLFSSDDNFFEGNDSYFKVEIESGLAVRVNRWSLNEIIDYLENVKMVELSEPSDALKYLAPEYSDAACIAKDIFRQCDAPTVLTRPKAISPDDD